MSERLKPLFEDASAPDELREFAQSARADGPNQEDLDRLAARVAAKLNVAGIVAPVATTLDSAPRDVAPTGGAQVGSHAAPLRRLIKSTRARVAAGVGLSAVIGMGLWGAQRAPAVAPSANAPAVVVSQAASSVAGPNGPKPEASPVAPVSLATASGSDNNAVEAGEKPAEQAPLHPRPPRAARHARSEPTAASPSAPAASELELIQQAEAARSNSGESLALLARHEQLYPRGTLAQEREVLAIEVLLRAGQLERANARASRFAVTYPDSAHLPRVHALISRADGD